MFSSKPDLLKHKKKEHRESVEKCRRFLQGDCKYSDESCYFDHDEKKDINRSQNKDSDESMELGESQNTQSDFYKVQDAKLAFQVKQIEISQKISDKLGLSWAKLKLS